MTVFHKPTELVRELDENEGSLKVSTGFGWLDEQLGGGLDKTDVLTVGAPSNVGKSRFTLGSAVNGALYHNQRSIVFSVEDGKYRVARRLREAVNTWPMIDDHIQFVVHSPTAGAIAAAIEESEGVDVVYFDYIQSLSSKDFSEIDTNMRVVKSACSAKDITMIMTSQLTEYKNAEGKIAFPPNKSWLRGSKGLIHKSDSIVLLWPGECGLVNGLLDKSKDTATGGRCSFVPGCHGELLLDCVQYIDPDPQGDEPW